MTAYFMDTSALIKAYVAETGSLWLQSQLWTAQTLFTSHLAAIEAVCALARRRREGVLTLDEHAQTSRALNYDLIYRYCLLDITPAVMDMACQLAERRPLRASDAIHLASAWLLNQQSLGLGHPPVLFLCADDRLLAAAQAEGLRTDNPSGCAPGWMVSRNWANRSTTASRQAHNVRLSSAKRTKSSTKRRYAAQCSSRLTK